MKSGLERLIRPAGEESVLTTVLEGEVVTRLDDTIGPSAYTRDDLLRERILEHFGFNLTRMVDIAGSVEARVFFVTPASNLRDASPFKSEHRAELSEADQQYWQGREQAARRLLAQGNAQEALVACDEAAKIDGRHADLHFLRGRALEAVEQFPAAKAAYERARDEDVCSLRAPDPIPKIVSEVATAQDVPLVDFIRIQEDRSDHGIPGAKVFLDHVHPTVESHRLLALEILKTMEREDILQNSPREDAVQQVTERVLGNIDAEPHSLALNNLSKVLGWAGKLREAYRAATEGAQLGPDVAEIQYQAGLCAQLLGRNAEAIQYYQRTVQLNPTASLAHGNLGVALEDSGRLSEAIRHFRLALQHGEAKDAGRNQKNLSRALDTLQRQTGSAEPNPASNAN